MKIEVCSQKKALELVTNAGESISVISITSKEEDDVTFPDNPMLVSILHLHFNDLTQEYDEEGIPYGRALPKPEDFAGLREFVQHLSCNTLIVHCWEGNSRSAAVGTAIYEYRHKTDDLRLQNSARPNRLVYALACRALGI
jgi:predicted protein tyrosine phosphatase